MKLDVLIHNVGHHDLYLILSNPGKKDILIRPINVKMNSIGEELLHFITAQNISLIQDESCQDTFKFSAPMRCHNGDAQKKKRWTAEAFVSKHATLSFTEETQILGFRIPIYYPVLEAFQRHTGELHSILLTKEEISDKGRSTKYIAELLSMAGRVFAHTVQTSILTHESHSDFSFPSEARFFRQQLSPLLRSLRQKVVAHYAATESPEDWVTHFHIQLSLNSGTTPVIISVLNALKEEASKLYLVKEAKQWPGPTAFRAEEIEKQSFIQIPAIAVSEITEATQKKAIAEMIAWKDDFTTAKPEREKKDEPAKSFFFRKGKQEVLATVVYEKEGELQVQRGVNLEVSLPTGSLCAERNAIGSILVNYPNLKRHEIKSVAVLALKETNPTLGPCGACKEWLRKITEVNPDFSIITFDDHAFHKVFVESIPMSVKPKK